MMVEYAPFTESQVDYYKRGIDPNYWLCLSEGGKRASKNVLNIAMWCEILEVHPDKIHVAAGVSQASAKMNILDSNGFGLQHYFEGRCREGNYLGVDCLYIDTKVETKIVLFAGGKDAISYRSIKGYSLGSVYCSEANECHQTFIQECFDRTLASNMRKVIFDFNAKPPRHWFYLDIVDFYVHPKTRKPMRKGINYGFFTIHDNMSLTDEQLHEALNTYPKHSLWYRAEILGKRTAASGRVYYAWDVKKNTFKWNRRKPDRKYKDFAIGVDVGGTDATVATLEGFCGNYGNCDLIDGFYDKQGEDEGMTHQAYAKLIVDKVEEWIAIYPRVSMCDMWVESADKLFRQAIVNELAARGLSRIQVHASYKKDGIVERIRLHNVLLDTGQLRVADHLEPWIEAYEQAVWSQDEKTKGNWVRVDDGSYPVDCLDSGEYGSYPYKAELMKGAVRYGADDRVA